MEWKQTYLRNGNGGAEGHVAMEWQEVRGEGGGEREVTNAKVENEKNGTKAEALKPDRGIINSIVTKLTSKGMMEDDRKVMNGGAKKVIAGGGMVKDTFRMMMDKRIPERKIKKPIQKRTKGAKFKFWKGIIRSGSDSSQPGIEQFIHIRKTIIGEIGMDSGIGGCVKSHGINKIVI